MDTGKEISTGSGRKQNRQYKQSRGINSPRIKKRKNTNFFNTNFFNTNFFNTNFFRETKEEVTPVLTTAPNVVQDIPDQSARPPQATSQEELAAQAFTCLETNNDDSALITLQDLIENKGLDPNKARDAEGYSLFNKALEERKEKSFLFLLKKHIFCRSFEDLKKHIGQSIPKESWENLFNIVKIYDPQKKYLSPEHFFRKQERFKVNMGKNDFTNYLKLHSLHPNLKSGMNGADLLHGSKSGSLIGVFTPPKKGILPDNRGLRPRGVLGESYFSGECKTDIDISINKNNLSTVFPINKGLGSTVSYALQYNTRLQDNDYIKRLVQNKSKEEKKLINADFPVIYGIKPGDNSNINQVSSSICEEVALENGADIEAITMVAVPQENLEMIKTFIEAQLPGQNHIKIVSLEYLLQCDKSKISVPNWITSPEAREQAREKLLGKTDWGELEKWKSASEEERKHQFRGYM